MAGVAAWGGGHCLRSGHCGPGLRGLLRRLLRRLLRGWLRGGRLRLFLRIGDVWGRRTWDRWTWDRPKCLIRPWTAARQQGIQGHGGCGSRSPSCDAHRDDRTRVHTRPPPARCAIGRVQVEPPAHVVWVQRREVGFECGLPQDDIVDKAQVVQLHDDVAQFRDLHLVVLLAKNINIRYTCVDTHYMYTHKYAYMYVYQPNHIHVITHRHQHICLYDYICV